MKGEPTLVRFWNKVSKTESAQECWEWIGSCTDGYGRFSDGNRKHKAHRFSYELAYGPIPEGMLVCHKCDNPACVNPGHLFLGTNTQNIHDSIRKKRFVTVNKMGEKHGLSKLTEKAVLEIRERYNSGKETMYSLAKRFCVDDSTINHVVARDTWKHI